MNVLNEDPAKISRELTLSEALQTAGSAASTPWITGVAAMSDIQRTLERAESDKHRRVEPEEAKLAKLCAAAAARKPVEWRG